MTSITYTSTRGGQPNSDFRTVVMTGLAHDRGLFVPDSFPTVDAEELESWRGLDYPGVAVKVISKFVQDDQVPADKMDDIVRRSCAAFRHEDVTPVISVGGHKVLVSRIFQNSTQRYRETARYEIYSSSRRGDPFRVLTNAIILS